MSAIAVDAAATDGDLFGSKPHTPRRWGSDAVATDGDLFGSNDAAATGAGLFESNAAATNGGLFGSINAAATNGGLFGSNDAAAKDGGLFGSNNAAAKDGGLFGSNDAAAKGAGLFGSNAAATNGGLFGSNDAAANGGWLRSEEGTEAEAGMENGAEESGSNYPAPTPLKINCEASVPNMRKRRLASSSRGRATQSTDQAGSPAEGGQPIKLRRQCNNSGLNEWEIHVQNWQFEWVLHDRFELIDHLGGGTYGQVCKARDTLSDSLVAVKMMDDIVDERHLLKRAMREVAILARIEHPNLVQLKHVWTHKTTDNLDLYMSFELLEGGDLRCLLNREILTSDRVQELMGGILAGVVHLHTIHVCHRCTAADFSYALIQFCMHAGT